MNPSSAVYSSLGHIPSKKRTGGNGLSMSIRSRLRAVPVLVWMVLIALLLRLAVIPFNRYLFEDLMDANHIHAWEQGNVARALLAGQGFGSPFVSTQPSAIGRASCRERGKI